MKKIVSILMVFLMCSSISYAKGPMKVVSTIGMITDAVKQVGGDYVTVQGLMGPGVDPHLYRASARDVQKLSRADIIIYGGLHLESKMGQILKKNE